MADHYFVNNNAQPSGEREVHKEGCNELKKVFSKTDLGYCNNCAEAVKKAGQIYPNVDGCYYCIPECHKK